MLVSNKHLKFPICSSWSVTYTTICSSIWIEDLKYTGDKAMITNQSLRFLKGTWLLWLTMLDGFTKNEILKKSWEMLVLYQTLILVHEFLSLPGFYKILTIT